MSEFEPDPGAAPDLAYYEAVPYLLVVESVERGGRWVRRAEHPELPGCFAEATSAVEAIEKLDKASYSLAEKLMNSTLQEALKDKKLSDF